MYQKILLAKEHLVVCEVAQKIWKLYVKKFKSHNGSKL